MIQKSLYDKEVYTACINRIEKLTEQTTPIWGKMSSAQMMAHCAAVQEVMNGTPLAGTPFYIHALKSIIRKAVLSRAPYPKNSKTHPQYIQAEQKDFETEKAHLLKTLESALYLQESQSGSTPHPLFGNLTRQEAGWAAYKHLEHHLTQFGV